jgi:nitrile hydratase subunit beta
MNGAQDLGGLMGFGPVKPEANEPVFHAAWERRALGVTLCCNALGEWNIDINRRTRESLHPVDYLRSSYYEIWIKGLTRLLAERGLVSPAELDAGRALGPARPTMRPPLKAVDVPAALAKGGPCNRPLDRAPLFAAGERVRTRNINPVGHTRLPRYARDKLGTIERRHDAFVFPDSNAQRQGEDPQWVYTVVFTGRALWGEAADPTLTVAFDCWEPYLEKA